MASEFSNQLKASQTAQGGKSLPPAMQAEAQRALAADFSNVKVHTSASKYQAGANIGVRAYATGRQITFQQGKYSPESVKGHGLLRHELTHVVQQTAQPK